MSGMDARLWRVLNRVWLILAVGVLGLMLGLGARPDRADSVLGLLIVVVVGVLVGTTLWQLPEPARRALRQLPRYRPLMALSGGLLALVTVLILCWTISNALAPGTLAPLSLALVGVVLAGVATMLGRRASR